MDEAEHRDRLLVRDQPAIGGDAGLVLAGGVVDRQHDLAAQHAALLVEIVGGDLAAAPDLLAEQVSPGGESGVITPKTIGSWGGSSRSGHGKRRDATSSVCSSVHVGSPRCAARASTRTRPAVICRVLRRALSTGSAHPARSSRARSAFIAPETSSRLPTWKPASSGLKAASRSRKIPV